MVHLRRFRTLTLLSLTGAVLLLGLPACDSTDFGGASQKMNSRKDKDGDDEDDDGTDSANAGKSGPDGPGTLSSDAVTAATVPVDSAVDGGGTAGLVFQSDDGRVRREVLDYGAEAVVPIVDYLFIVDNSPSMGDNVTQLQNGFRSLTADLFPAKAKVGIMSTLGAVPGNLGTPLNGADQEPVAAVLAEPGYLRLVNKAGIAAYKASSAPATAKAAFSAAGCDSGWFGPGDMDAGGVRCFDAHTPISRKGGGCETGILAYRQILQRLGGGERLFRKAAVAHVIFVSDTHDPGCGGATGTQAKAEHRDYAALKSETQTNSPDLSGIKFHGIIPSKVCGGSEGNLPFGRTYSPIITASGGKELDLCTATDFKGVLEQIVADAKPQTAVFQLSKPAKSIIHVKVAGQPVTNFSFRNGDIVEITNMSPSTKVQVEIAYEVQ